MSTTHWLLSKVVLQSRCSGCAGLGLAFRLVGSASGFVLAVHRMGGSFRSAHTCSVLCPTTMQWMAAYLPPNSPPRKARESTHRFKLPKCNDMVRSCSWCWRPLCGSGIRLARSGISGADDPLQLHAALEAARVVANMTEAR